MLVYGSQSKADPTIDDGHTPPNAPFIPKGTEAGSIVGLSSDEVSKVRTILFGDVCDSLTMYVGHIDEGRPFNYSACKGLHQGRTSAGLHSTLANYMDLARTIILRREQSLLYNWTGGIGNRTYQPEEFLSSMTDGFIAGNMTSEMVVEPYTVTSELKTYTFKM